MKIKKIVALLVAATMAMTTLVGCGGANNTSAGGSQSTGNGDVEKVTLKVWVPEEEMEITDAMCKAFDEAYPQFDCTFELAVVGIDESVNALETDADTAADVFTIPSGSMSQLVEAGLIYPITAESETINALYGAGALEACKKNDLLYGIPFSPNSWFMYYDKSLYTEEEVKNLDVMMAKDLGEDIYNFSCSISNSWYIEAFFYAAGCTLYGEDGTDPKDCTWNSAAGIEAAKYIIDLANNAKYIEDKDGIAGSLMKEGKLGALCSGTWAGPELKEAMGDRYGAVALPTINLSSGEAQLSNFADYKCFTVKSNTAHPLAAQLLAEWLCNEENQLIRYQECGATPTVLSLQENEELAKDPAACALIAQTQFAVPQPSISQISNYWTPVQTLGEGIISGEINAANIKESLDTVVESVTSTLTE